jgi:hypothetical protein
MASTLTLLHENLKLAQASAAVLQESCLRAQPLLASPKTDLSPGERETLEALTARFARLADFLVQRLFRTLDEHELVSEGTVLDCLNRMEKRGIIPSTQTFRDIRALRNEIAHEYLIEKSDSVVRESLEKSAVLFQALASFEAYCTRKGY